MIEFHGTSGAVKMAKHFVMEILAAGERDWIVRERGGRELGHYSSRREAEAIGTKLARTRGVELIIDDGSGPAVRWRPKKGWFTRLFSRS